MPLPSRPPTTTTMTMTTSADQVFSNPDLLFEILTHIPTKPLLILKPTNTLFHKTITSTPFSLRHSLLHTHTPSSSLLLLHPTHPLHHSHFSFIPLSPSPPSPFSPLPPPLPPSLSPLQSSNGLLLSLSPLPLLLNPTTNTHLSLSLPTFFSFPFLSLSLIFDPSFSPFFYLISIYQNNPKSTHPSKDNAYSLGVFSSREKKWEEEIDFFVAPFDTEFDRGVCCGSRVYWLSHTESMSAFDVRSRRVIDVAMPVADGGIDGVYIERFRYLGESCGYLHLIEIATNCVSEFDVLELREREEGGEEWVKRFRVELDVLGRGFEREMFQDGVDRFGRRLRFYAFSVLAVVRSGREGRREEGEGEGERLVVSVPGKVVCFDMEKKVSRLLCEVVDESDKWLPFKGYNAFQYIESLYPL